MFTPAPMPSPISVAFCANKVITPAAVSVGTVRLKIGTSVADVAAVSNIAFPAGAVIISPGAIVSEGTH